MGLGRRGARRGARRGVFLNGFKTGESKKGNCFEVRYLEMKRAGKGFKGEEVLKMERE